MNTRSDLSTIDVDVGSPRRPLLKRVAGWVPHLLLIAVSAVFLAPYLWMLASSMKTDEEIAADRVFPASPRFRETSPYLREPPAIEKPYEVSGDAFERGLAAMRPLAAAAVAQAAPPAGVSLLDEAALRSAAVQRLVARLVPRMPLEAWEQGVAAEVQRQLTGDLPAQALEDSVALLELRGLQIQLLDGTTTNVDTPDTVARWTIERGDAAIVREHGHGFLRYGFADASSDPVVLRVEFDLPGGIDTLHKLLLPMRGDDSWHRLNATLDVGTRRWTSQHDTFIAQHRPFTVLLQPPTFDDQTLRPKRWVPLREQDDPAPQAVPEGRAVLRLLLEPSSTMTANAGKAARNYLRAFRGVPFWRYVANSVVIVVLSVVGSMIASSFVAYAFARLHWPGRSVALLILLSTMMLPGQVTMVPSFLIWREVGLYNTLIPLWLPAWFGGAFFIFLMTQHMKTIPKELDEAAALDGLGPVGTWWHVIVPQTHPALAAIAILSFMGAWNQFMGPLIYLRDQAKFPLSLGLFAMQLDSNFATDVPVMMAGNILMTLPVIVVFFLFQRYFVQGMTMSGIK
jgi:ABC-type glycerol-3-phosphate transport system permease component